MGGEHKNSTIKADKKRPPQVINPVTIVVIAAIAVAPRGGWMEEGHCGRKGQIMDQK